MSPAVQDLDKALLVGQVVTVHEVVVIATITCRCRPTNTPAMILDTGGGVICIHCGRLYAITKLQFDRAVDAKVKVAVGRVIAEAPV